MADLFLLSEAQMRRIERYFPLSRGIARVDDRRVISGIVFVIRNGLRWRDAPGDYGPHKTIYNRFVRWSRLGVFNKIFAELARKAGKPSRLMIAIYLALLTVAPAQHRRARRFDQRLAVVSQARQWLARSWRAFQSQADGARDALDGCGAAQVCGVGRA